MKSDRGMGTLMTVFSGVAALLCLLVGLQLLFLESQIGQSADTGHTGPGQQLLQWKAQAHTSAIMSLGAGVLIFLFGVRHHATTGPVKRNRRRDTDPVMSADDIESVSVRIFEVDTEDRSVEITPSVDAPRLVQSRPRLPVSPPTSIPGPDTEPVGDQTDSIVSSIRAAAAPTSGRNTFPPVKGSFLPSFLVRLFRHRRPR